MMEGLITAGAAVDAARADGFRPVHCALHRGRKPREQALDAARLLLNRGAEYTIYLAAEFGDTESVRAALQRDGSQANHTDTQWWRPITAASRRRDFEMVKLLLEHGAHPNLPEEGAPVGQALWTAVYLDQPEIPWAPGLKQSGPRSSGLTGCHNRHGLTRIESCIYGLGKKYGSFVVLTQFLPVWGIEFTRYVRSPPSGLKDSTA
ncbi:MAG TPA: ankyrin repeat domain-containing protein [Candidatus Sulfotelmatobacter sp.]|nr:ankyrin repeat domain-containing protein [Candidatus Sulfotelmatobacter sp.]